MPLQQSRYFQATSLVQKMHDRNELPRALLSGVYGIREGIKNTRNDTVPSIAQFIPKEDGESKDMYQNRLLRTYITPYFENAITSATGQIFANPLIVEPESSESIPELLQTYINDNSDLEGVSLNERLIQATHESFAYGMVIAFVDYINPSESDNLADQQASGARPYLKIISPNDLLGYSTDDMGRLTMIRYMEEAMIDEEDFGQSIKRRVRVVRPESWAVYEGEGNEAVDEGVIVRFDQSGNQITDEIPVAVMYGRKLGTMDAASVFEAMAYINLHHTQVNSDLSWSSHFYLIPFLFTVLGDDAEPPEEGQPIIPKLASYINVTLPKDSDIKWIETNGAAQDSASKYLQDVEDRIKISTMSTNVGATGSKETATGRAIDMQTTTAKLKLHAEAVENFAEKIITLMASYMRGETLPKFKVIANKEFSINDDADSVRVLKEMVSDGMLSNSSLLQEIKRRGIVADDFDVAVELERIIEEQGAAGVA